MNPKKYMGYNGDAFVQCPLVLGQIKRIFALIKDLDIGQELFALGIGGDPQPVYDENGNPVLDENGQQALGMPGFDAANLPPLIGKLGEKLPSFLAAVLLPPGKTPHENRSNPDWEQTVEDGLPVECIPDVVADFFDFNLSSSFLEKLKALAASAAKSMGLTSSMPQSSGSPEGTPQSTT